MSDIAGYRHLRQQLTGPNGIQAICLPSHALAQVREMRADQYGIRTMLRVDNVNIKFEIVLEGRIALETPSSEDRLCGVATLTPLDMATSKLLANSDRWRDDATQSRDLIDLAMMAPSKPLLRQALAKAQNAYGTSVQADLAKAIQTLSERPHRLSECMANMGMNSIPIALLWERIRALAAVMAERH